MKLDFLLTLDWLFPPEPEEAIVRQLRTTQRDALYRPHKRDDVTILLSYQNRTVQALIHQAKFHYNQAAYMHLGALLRQYLVDTIDADAILIPVPLAQARWRERGYNQVREVIRHSNHSTLPRCHLNTQTLYRTRNTIAQTKLRKKDRLHNLTEAFALTKPHTLTGKQVLLLDDVCTTGSTLRAAAAAVQTAAPASVTKLAWAG